MLLWGVVLGVLIGRSLRIDGRNWRDGRLGRQFCGGCVEFRRRWRSTSGFDRVKCTMSIDDEWI